ncbi:MAG: hypothetical protein N3D73_01965 [Candidatus Diapherotrites archaeon]|nr:hypothetical protein [Candidatus Diapherotrites archaeon]
MLKLSGACDDNSPIEIIVSVYDIIIINELIDCHNNSFNYEKRISFLYPHGDWEITIQSKKSKVKSKIKVLPSRESSYYVITFLSPILGSYSRESSLKVTVKVTNAGRNVDDANVILWFFEPIELLNKGDGIYSRDINLRFNERLGNKKLIVTAESKKNNFYFGGEDSIDINIEKAKINIELLEPKEKFFELTDKIYFLVSVSYESGNFLDNNSFVIITFSDSNFFMKRTSNNLFEFSMSISKSGNFPFSILVYDSAGNNSYLSSNLHLSCSILCLIKIYGAYIISIILIIFILFYLFYERISIHIEEKLLEEEKKRINKLVEELQKEYFVRAVMPYSTYNKTLAEYKSKLAVIEEKERILKKRRDNL